MRSIISRIRRLETAAVPAERERAALAMIEANRRRHMGADHKPLAPFPPGTFDGCRTGEERIIRGRVALMKMEQEATRTKQGVGPGEAETSKQN
jgi:hypothetical protein